jgi:hypothetical protein
MDLKHLLHATYHVTRVHVGYATFLEVVLFFHTACATEKETGDSNTQFLKPDVL